MLADTDVIAFVGTTDLAVARAFYGETLGLRLVESNDVAAVFDANGTMLRVTAVPDLTPAGFTVLGWAVADAAAAAAALRERGVECERFDGMPQDDDGVWTAPDGARIAWFKDPDGNTLSVTQFPS